DADVVCALRPTAAEVKGDEEVVVIPSANDEWRLDGAGLTRPARSARECVERLVLCRKFARARVQLAQLDAAPEASEREPGLSRLVQNDVGVDGVPVVGARRADHLPLILPYVVHARRVEREVGREPDGRMVTPEGGDGI